MLWIQALVSFALWIAYGVVLARLAPSMRKTFSGQSRRRRTVLGPVLMVLGAVLLLVGIGGIGALRGLGPTGLKPWAWLVLTVIGLGFVHAQSVASLLMISLATETEPAGTGGPSDGRINKKNSDEAKTAAHS